VGRTWRGGEGTKQPCYHQRAKSIPVGKHYGRGLTRVPAAAGTQGLRGGFSSQLRPFSTVGVAPNVNLVFEIRGAAGPVSARRQTSAGPP